jgi:hypothetical protein
MYTYYMHLPPESKRTITGSLSVVQKEIADDVEYFKSWQRAQLERRSVAVGTMPLMLDLAAQFTVKRVGESLHDTLYKLTCLIDKAERHPEVPADMEAFKATAAEALILGEKESGTCSVM